MEKATGQDRVKSIDALRTIAILGVVIIHTTTRTLEASHFDLNTYSWTLFLNQMFRFAAPLFFIISGFVLELNYNNHKSIFSYIKSRISKIFIPYIFWSFIYLTFVYTKNPDSYIRALLTGSASYQLYFIPTLCIFYILFPIFHRLNKLLINIWFLLLLFITQSSLLNHDYFIKQFQFVEPIRTVILSYFSFSIGVAASHYQSKINEFTTKVKYILTTLLGFLALYIFYEGKNNYLKTFNYETFYSQWRVNVLIYALFTFAFLFYLFGKPKFQHSFIQKISSLSFFTFFIHIIILEGVWKYMGQQMFSLTTNSFFWKIFFDPLFFTAVFGFSLVLGYLVHKIPKLSKITG